MQKYIQAHNNPATVTKKAFRESSRRKKPGSGELCDTQNNRKRKYLHTATTNHPHKLSPSQEGNHLWSKPCHARDWEQINNVLVFVLQKKMHVCLPPDDTLTQGVITGSSAADWINYLMHLYEPSLQTALILE